MTNPLPPAFTNRPNQQITDTTGKQHWISRSTAVVAVPLFYVRGTPYTPLGKRASTKELFPNYWGLPCGFIDWGESAAEAVRREVWEELGLELTPEMVNGQPDWVVSDPNPGENETISLRFIIRVVTDGNLPRLVCSGETPEVRWLTLDEEGVWKRHQLAFNHCEIIEWALSK